MVFEAGRDVTWMVHQSAVVGPVRGMPPCSSLIWCDPVHNDYRDEAICIARDPANVCDVSVVVWWLLRGRLIGSMCWLLVSEATML